MSTGGSGGDEAALLRQRLDELNKRANAGDGQALAELRRFLDEHPEVEGHVWQLARVAEDHWVELLVGGDALGREAVRRAMTKLKAGLAGPSPTAMEALVVDLVAVNHLAERHAEIAAASPGPASVEVAALRLRRAESAQRRYLASLKMLATLRARLPLGLAPGGGPRLYDPGKEAA